MSAVLILEVSSLDNWQGHHSGRENRIIPLRYRPTVLQAERPSAEAEMVRLQRVHPGCRFVAFEAVAVSTLVEVPTHVTLGGQVVGIQRQVRIVDLGVDDGIPF